MTDFKDFKARLALKYGLVHEHLSATYGYYMLPKIPCQEEEMDIFGLGKGWMNAPSFGSFQHLKDWCRDHIDFILTNEMVFIQYPVGGFTAASVDPVILILNYLTIEEVVAITEDKI